MKMPVLSLWRPWTTLVLHCGKNVENRVWPTIHRGPLLIHGAKGWDPRALVYARQVARQPDAPLGADGRTLADLLEQYGSDNPDDHPTGILGPVELTGVCGQGRANPGQRCPRCSLWAMHNQFHWQVRDPQPFAEPIQVPGKQRLFTVDDRLWPAVAAQLAAAGRVNHPVGA